MAGFNINDPKTLKNTASELTDLLMGDDDILSRPEFKNIDLGDLQIALDFIINNPHISKAQKATLLENSWRVNFRAKPPTPEEFLTEKYLGLSALHTYPRVKKCFLEFMDPNNSARNAILFPFIGFGKLIADTDYIFSPKGPKLAKDMKVGDEVCDELGSIAHVKNVQHFPDEFIYEITFSDGRKVGAGGPHFWQAAHSFNIPKHWNEEKQAYEKGSKVPCWKIITTEEIIKDLEKHPKHRWFIPICKPAYHEEKSHVISPYALGAYLGDGCFGKDSSSTISGDDEEIFTRIQKECPSLISSFRTPLKKGSCTVNYQLILNNLFKQELSRLHLEELESENKFIPDEYLYDSVENRIALLQGLMDTDGTVENIGQAARSKNRRPQASFWTSSKRLAEGIMLLVRGLGGIARCHFVPRGKPGTHNHDAYLVYFHFHDFIPMFHLKRKLQPMLEDSQRELGSREKRKPEYLYIKSIIKTDHKGGTCIETDTSSHLFLTNDYIVTHNSYLSVLINLYVATHMALMRNPWKYFGLNPATQLTQLLISYSIKKSGELLLDPFMSILAASPFFERIKTLDGMLHKEDEFQRNHKVNKIYWTTAAKTSDIMFSGGTTIKLTSSVQGLLGLSVVTATMSELTFFTLAGKSDDYIMELYNKTRGRVYSRMKGNYYGRTILDSSPNNLDSPIDSYIMNDARKDKTNYIIEGSIWKWVPEDYPSGNTFNVYTGGSGDPPRIIENEAEIPNLNPTKVLKVPEELHQFFKDDLIESIKDLAGIPVGNQSSLITNYAILEECFEPNLRNLYYAIEADSKSNPRRLIWDQIADKFFKKKAGNLEFWYKPLIPRCISVDQSFATDTTCIAMSHPERLPASDDIVYITDFTIVIIPVKGSHINLAAIGEFIEELHVLGHLNIEHVSFDQFQSETTVQNLERDGYNVEKLSVDRTNGPYLDLLELIRQGRWKVGRNIFIKNNLKSLHMVGPDQDTRRKNPKIDHDNSKPPITTSNDMSWETSLIGSYGKDSTDAIAASIQLVKKYYPLAIDTWDPEATKIQGLASSDEDRAEAYKKMRGLAASLGISL